MSPATAHYRKKMRITPLKWLAELKKRRVGFQLGEASRHQMQKRPAKFSADRLSVDRIFSWKLSYPPLHRFQISREEQRQVLLEERSHVSQH